MGAKVHPSIRENEFTVDLLDRWIRYAVWALHENGVKTYESCQGGKGHAFPEPTVRFEGTRREAFRAVEVAREHGLPVHHLRQFWRLTEQGAENPAWEMTFFPVSRLRAVQRAAERDRYDGRNGPRRYHDRGRPAASV